MGVGELESVQWQGTWLCCSLLFPLNHRCGELENRKQPYQRAYGLSLSPAFEIKSKTLYVLLCY
jgi:hypothetical protein